MNPTDKEIHATVIYDNALSFIVKADFLDRDQLMWLRSKLNTAASWGESKTVDNLLNSMIDYIDSKIILG